MIALVKVVEMLNCQKDSLVFFRNGQLKQKLWGVDFGSNVDTKIISKVLIIHDVG